MIIKLKTQRQFRRTKGTLRFGQKSAGVENGRHKSIPASVPVDSEDKFSSGRPSRLLNARATNSAGDENDRQVSILARVPVDSAMRFHQPTSRTPVSDKSDSALEFTISKIKHILFGGWVRFFFY